MKNPLIESQPSVAGIGRHSQYGRLQPRDFMEYSAIVKTNAPLARLSELRLLRNGWLDGRGSVPTPEQFVWLEHFFKNRYQPTLPAPLIYPTAEGGVQFEWRVGNQDITLEIALENKSAELHALNIETGVDIYERIDLGAQQGLEVLTKFLVNAQKCEA